MTALRIRQPHVLRQDLHGGDNADHDGLGVGGDDCKSFAGASHARARELRFAFAHVRFTFIALASSRVRLQHRLG